MDFIEENQDFKFDMWSWDVTFVPFSEKAICKVLNDYKVMSSLKTI